MTSSTASSPNGEDTILVSSPPSPPVSQRPNAEIPLVAEDNIGDIVEAANVQEEAVVTHESQPSRVQSMSQSLADSLARAWRYSSFRNTDSNTWGSALPHLFNWRSSVGPDLSDRTALQALRSDMKKVSGPLQLSGSGQDRDTALDSLPTRRWAKVQLFRCLPEAQKYDMPPPSFDWEQVQARITETTQKIRRLQADIDQKCLEKDKVAAEKEPHRHALQCLNRHDQGLTNDIESKLSEIEALKHCLVDLDDLELIADAERSKCREYYQRNKQQICADKKKKRCEVKKKNADAHYKDIAADLTKKARRNKLDDHAVAEALQYLGDRISTIKDSTLRELNYSSRLYFEQLYEDLLAWKNIGCHSSSPLTHPFSVWHSLTREVGDIIQLVWTIVGTAHEFSNKCIQLKNILEDHVACLDNLDYCRVAEGLRGEQNLTELHGAGLLSYQVDTYTTRFIDHDRNKSLDVLAHSLASVMYVAAIQGGKEAGLKMMERVWNVWFEVWPASELVDEDEVELSVEDLDDLEALAKVREKLLKKETNRMKQVYYFNSPTS
ncbi:hypothetical protein V5O48_017305, partial [Marasmius crinis-equi]